MRRNQKSAAAVVFLLFSTILSSPNSFASIKPGTKCTKAGKTEIFGEKKFTCIKSGKKLIWNSGKKISQPAKNAAGEVKPAAALTDHEIVINTISKDWEKWKANASSTFTPLKVFVEDGYEPNWKTYIPKASDFLISIFEGNGYPLLQAPVSVFGDSEEFISSTSKPYCSNKIPENRLGIYCGRIQAGYGQFLLGLPESEKFANGKVLTNAQKLQISDYVARDIAIMYELQAQYGNVNYNGAKNQIPAWIRQGFVELFAALALKDTSETKLNHSELLISINAIEPFPNKLCSKTLQDFESKDRNWGNSCISSQNIYATELLVARHGGLKTLFEFVKLFGQTDDWTTSFKKAFGITREDFYAEWYDYLKIPASSRPALTPPAPAVHY